MTTDGDGVVAAELRLLRNEIAALRAAGHRERGTWLPTVHAGHLVLPEQHYRLMRAIRTRVFHRSAAGALSHEHISRQRRIAIWMTMFSAARTVVWVIAMLLIVAHWCGVGGTFMHWFTGLSGSIIFVTFISFYCNASTDAANLAASVAALFSADSHAATVTAGTARRPRLRRRRG